MPRTASECDVDFAREKAVNTSPEARALVTGAAGFLGSHVTDVCLDLGMEVVATDDLSGGSRDNLPAGTPFIQGDIRDADFVASLWDHGPFDYVYHLAAYAAEGLSHFIRAYNYRTNLEATMHLVNHSVLGDVKRFVFTSSIAVYGANQLPMTEDLVPQPEDPYGISKYAVELDLAAAQRMFGLNYTTFRPHNVYGERQNISDKYRNVVGIFMNSVLRGEPMPIFGNGRQTRAFSHVGDVAHVIARSPLVPAAANETFNVGGADPCSVLELAELVADEFDVPCEVQHFPPRNEVVHAFSDHTKVRRVFDLSDPIDLRSGIARMAEWVRRHGADDPVGFDGAIEIPRNMPPSWAGFARPADRARRS
jgi:UDP-glucose 4-epimerase